MQIVAMVRYRNNQVIQNLLKIILGAGFGQVITLVATPIVARLYGPESFGLQGTLMAFVGFISIATSLSFPMAIVVAKDEGRAIALAIISTVFCLVSSILLTCIILLSEGKALEFVGLEILSPYIIWVPILATLITINNSAIYFLSRNNAFSLYSSTSVITSSLTNTTKVVLGTASSGTPGLIIANALGYMVAPIAGIIYWFNHCEKNTPLTVSRMRSVVIEHRDFVYMRTPQSIIWAISQSIPLVMLASGFGAVVAGKYALAIAIVGSPASLFASAITLVLFPKVSKNLREGKNIRLSLIKATWMTLSGTIIPLFVVMAFGPSLFSLLLGDEWREAGIIAAILSPWIWLRIASKPAEAAIPGLGLQRGLLIYELFSAGSKLLAFWVGIVWFTNPFVAISLFSMAGTTTYIIFIAWVLVESNSSRVSEN